MPNLTPDGKFTPEVEQQLSDWISGFIGKGLSQGIVPPSGTVGIVLSDDVNMAVSMTAKLSMLQAAHGTEPGYAVSEFEYEVVPLPGITDLAPTDDGHPQQ